MDAAEYELFDRALRSATDSGTGETLDAALAELGWHDALAADRHVAVALLFGAQGEANVTSSALDAVLATALGETGSGGGVAVVLPPLRGIETPGRLEGDRCVVRGLGTAALARSETAIVVAVTDAGPTAFAVKPSALDFRSVAGLDPALGLVEVTAEFDPAAAERRGTVDWSAAVAAGHLALGHELVGAGRAMLGLARQHAVDRVQFDRPISSFQAIRHRLAESLVAVETAASLLDAAWDEPSPVTAAMAKAMAGRSARTVARHAQQVLAGIGFTTEHPFHCYLRRTIVLDELLGAGRELTRRLGTDVLRSGQLPPAFPL
jgi:hypothetical protein